MILKLSSELLNYGALQLPDTRTLRGGNLHRLDISVGRVLKLANILEQTNRTQVYDSQSTPQPSQESGSSFRWDKKRRVHLSY